MLPFALALVATLTTIPAYAQIFKCTDSSGAIEYRDAKCPAETTSTALDIPAQITSGSNPAANVPSEAPAAPKQKRTEMVAKYSFPGPRTIPPPLPVAALPPPPQK